MVKAHQTTLVGNLTEVNAMIRTVTEVNTDVCTVVNGVMAFTIAGKGKGTREDVPGVRRLVAKTEIEDNSTGLRIITVTVEDKPAAPLAVANDCKGFI